MTVVALAVGLVVVGVLLARHARRRVPDRVSDAWLDEYHGGRH